ncbi:MFS transporter [Streptomyces sp. RFCAC02]|uniref:MFS transporter n=1 Tax=Streptomyces sp. RFCAC02 TaxID=2499143 RepID=UPI00101FFCE9|nr:MFS transporter [Streptomyces sp. RFCAC02]
MTTSPGPSGTKPLAALVAAVAGYALMQTLVVPALGLLGEELDASPTWTAWVLTAFLLSSAVLTPLLGRLGDQYGRRRVLRWVLVVQVVACAGAAVAGNIGELIAARAVQGAGLSVLPLAIGILREALPADRAALGTGLVSGVMGVGAGAGLVAGGLIADHTTWRALFVLGALLAAVSLLLVTAWVRDDGHPAGGRLDPAGAVLLGGGLAAALLALTEGPAWGWGSWRTVGLFALAAVLLALLAVVESGRRDALVDIREFTHRPMLVTHLAAFAFGALSYVFYVALPQFARTPHETAGYGFGATVTGAGLLMLPSALVMLPAGMSAGRFPRRAGESAPLVTGFLVCGAGALLLAVAHGAAWQHLVFYTLVGVGSGLVMAALPQRISALTPPSRTGTANGLNNIARTVGGAVGSQVTALFLTPGAAGGPVGDSAYGGLFLVATGIGLAGAVIAPLAIGARRDTGEPTATAPLPERA